MISDYSQGLERLNIRWLEEKEGKQLGRRMKLEKGILTIVVEGLKWMSEADSRKKTNLMYSDW